jgi:hypothetical protein
MYMAFKTQTIDSILKTFQTAVDALDVLINKEQNKAEDAAIRVAEAQADEALHMAEVARAKKVRGNIAKLIG